MLKIEKLKKYYKDVKAVNGITLDIEKGQIFGFIGPNGAGKSTTIKCIMNSINKTDGEIYIDNTLDTKENFNLKEDIGYLPSEINLYDDLTVKEMIKYSDSFYMKDCTKRANELANRLKLDQKKKIEELSLGNLKKVGIVLALMHEPKLVILDEATSGLDPLMQEEFYEILLEEKKKGTTIFFSSHVLSEIKKICDKLAIIKEGKIIEIKDIKTFSNDFVNVTIESKDIKKIKKEIKMNIISEDTNTIKFIYKDSVKTLLSKLNEYDIDKLLIEEPQIEEIFMHFYK